MHHNHPAGFFACDQDKIRHIDLPDKGEQGSGYDVQTGHQPHPLHRTENTGLLAFSQSIRNLLEKICIPYIQNTHIPNKRGYVFFCLLIIN